MMRVNIENFVNKIRYKTIRFVLRELVGHLKELRDRTDAGDAKALQEFFDIYRFSDNDSSDRSGIHPSLSKLADVQEALNNCHEAFRRREHAGGATMKLLRELERIFDMPYKQYKDGFDNPHGYNLDGSGQPICSHCNTTTTAHYRQTPDLICWKCGNLIGGK